jgi:hypothetical protein
VFIVIALLALTTLVLVLVTTAVWSARVTAKALGLRPFRWFDAGPPEDRGKRFIVRAVSSLSGLVVAILLGIVAQFVEGKSVPSLEIHVREGRPAAAAGLRDGDRIVAVAGTSVSTGDQVRAALSAPGDLKQVEVMRDGERKRFDVRPESGRIGVEFVEKREPFSVPETIAGGIKSPFVLWATMARTVLGESQSEVMGPVGIVNAADDRSRGVTGMPRLLGMLASLYWPLLAGVHLYAALTRLLFDRAYPGTADGERTATLFRLHQALVISLFCLAIAFMAHLAMAVAALHPAALLILLVAPATVSVYPLVWTLDQTLTARPSYFRSSVLVLPCIAPFAAIGIAFETRKRLREAGLAKP